MSGQGYVWYVADVSRLVIDTIRFQGCQGILWHQVLTFIHVSVHVPANSVSCCTLTKAAGSTSVEFAGLKVSYNIVSIEVYVLYFV